MKRLVALLLPIALLMFSATPVAAQERTCFTNGNYHAGRGIEFPAGTEPDRVHASVDTYPTINSGFTICDDTLTDFDDNGPAAWVSIEPAVGNPVRTADTIFQVGIIQCSSFGNGACDGDGDNSFFWAYGGCNGATPTVRDLGPTDGAWHELQVSATASTFYAYIDDVARAHIARNDPAVSCWSNTHKRVTWFGEKWDKGDSFGEASLWINGLTVRYDDMWYRAVGGNSTHLNGGSCYVSDPVRDFCVQPSGTDTMQLWTDQP